MIEKAFKKYLAKENLQKNKKNILIVLGIIVIFFVVFNAFNKPLPKNIAKKELILTVPKRGGLPSLHLTMEENKKLRSNIKEILCYDKAALFVNYPQVNGLITESMFLWIGIPVKDIKTKKRQELAEIFLRKFYKLPPNDPIRGNPLLKKNPWADLFNNIKARILMQGHGHEIYDGVAYYDSENDKMVIEGSLSQSYIESFGAFIKSQPAEKQKGYKNNYLLFVGETLGFKNLSDAEKKMLKDNGFL